MERQTQEERARQAGGGSRYYYKCADGETFSAYAVNEAAAFRVLNAERPGMMAELIAFDLE